MHGSRWVLVFLFALVLGLSPREEAAAQMMALTPTFQGGLSLSDPVLPQSEFLALGFMVGVNRNVGWWQPHVWFQRYQIDSYRPGVLPSGGDGGTRITGWMVSVGPAIRLLKSGRLTGDFLPMVGLGSMATSNVNGGAGVHIGVDAGFFQPRLLGRFQSLGTNWYWSFGVGMTFEVRLKDVFSEDSPWG